MSWYSANVCTSMKAGVLVVSWSGVFWYVLTQEGRWFTSRSDDVALRETDHSVNKCLVNLSLLPPSLHFKNNNGFWQPVIESSWFYCQCSPAGAAPCGGVKRVIYQDCVSHLKSLVITGSVTATAGPGLRSLTWERQNKPCKQTNQDNTMRSLGQTENLQCRH